MDTGYCHLTPLPPVERVVIDDEWAGTVLDGGSAVLAVDGEVELHAVPRLMDPGQARELAAALLAVARRAEEG